MADTKAEPKESCWKRLNCCKRKKKEPASGDEPMAKKKINETAEGAPTEETQKRGKCRLCLDKFFCCKRTNKIETMEKSSTMKEMTSSKSKCCSSSCFPCRRKAKPKEATAWTEHGEVVEDMMPAKLTCWQRVKDKLLCCRKKETRRTSMASKKQSLAPTIPPEDKRKKLDNVLVEHGSMMKGAIPVLPVCLAWFCLICNCLVPGLGLYSNAFFLASLLELLLTFCCTIQVPSYQDCCACVLACRDSRSLTGRGRESVRLSSTALSAWRRRFASSSAWWDGAGPFGGARLC